MPDFEESERVKEIAEKLIEKHHSHLQGRNIAYILKKSGDVDRQITEPLKGKRTKIAKARKVQSLWNFLCGFDFVLEVDEKLWDLLDVNHQEAIIDEQLCRCGWDAEKGGYMRDPLAVFPEVIERHGFFSTDLQEFRESFSQLNLFNPPPRQGVAPISTRH